MKYWVNVRRRWKFQLRRNKPNILKNLIWPIEHWSEHSIPSEFQGGLLVRMQMKKNHITNLKSAFLNNFDWIFASFDFFPCEDCPTKCEESDLKFGEPCQLPELVNC